MIQQGKIEVDSVGYDWSVHRQPTWVTSGAPRLLGLAIQVTPEEPNTRELLLEFDISRGHRNMSHHQRFKVPNVRLLQCIRSAIEAGYDPSSRGKPFRFSAGSTEPQNAK